MANYERLIADVRAKRAPDARYTVFDIYIEKQNGRIHISGETTEPEAADELVQRVRGESGDSEILDEVVRLPDPVMGSRRHALVRSAVAPLHVRPALNSPQATQYVLGHRLDLLSRREDWHRVKGEDNYVGWVHQGFLEIGDADWARTWERDDGSERVVSLGAELIDEADRVFARLPWGARLFRDTPTRLRLPDGRRGALGAGEVAAVDRLPDRFPPRGESVMRTARRWVGTPYLWGGVTPAGADCSGFVQSVLWMHGIALPRDADQQVGVGGPVGPGDRFQNLMPADLLFFAEKENRVTHVAISFGGSHIIHSALTNGGVEVNDIAGDLGLERKLADAFVESRRILPDAG